MITKIASATAYDKVRDDAHAEECGHVLGHFHRTVSDMDASVLIDPLPGFHITPNYLAKYDLTRASTEAQARVVAAADGAALVAFIEQRRPLVPLFQDALARGELKMRIMHGDPKINNIMVDDYTGMGTAIIDLDTVSPGLFHFDFGDAIRSICNPAGEEEPDLTKVVFSLALCQAFSKGYMKHERGTLEAVIAARNLAFGASNTASKDPSNPEAMQGLLKAESSLKGSMGRMMLVVERYPDLKADKSMALLMEELTSTENKISFARQAYNDAVTAYNTKRESFPTNFIANTFNFQEASLFEVTEAVEREAVKVQF
jgi:hypothetical protein